jgi:LemA protein
MTTGLWIVLGALAVVAGFVWWTYNRIVARRNSVDSSWAQIDVQLRKRHDLIPALVEAVRGYAAHESSTLIGVSEARSAAQRADRVGERAGAERDLGRATADLLAVSEAYPQLEATTNFSQLAAELRDVEDQIVITRRVYNDTVETYNTQIQIFPALLVARLFGFQPREFFDAPVAAEATPSVDLSSTGR